jgi:hypothetical protein
LQHPITVHRGTKQKGIIAINPMRYGDTVCPSKFKRVPKYVKELRAERARKLASERYRRAWK